MYKVSREDRKEISKFHWYLHKSSGYMCSKIKGEQVFMHRFLLGFPEDSVDHINRNKLDNRRSNLRVAGHHLNIVNRGLQANSTTGLKGVCYQKKNKRYVAGIAKPRIYLGCYTNAADAAYVYDCFAEFIYGKYAITNMKL